VNIQESVYGRGEMMPSVEQEPDYNRPDKAPGRTRKRLFIGLVLCTSLIVCLFLMLLWGIPYIGLPTIHPSVPWIFGALVLAAILIVLWAALGLVLNVLLGKDLPFFKRMRGVSVKLFLPLMTLLGRILGLSKQKIRASFISVNNELVISKGRKYAPDELLLLMPHCLQRSDCKVRLTYNIQNCKHCGKCPIAGLIALSAEYGVHLVIATGGTIARRIVARRRPRLILAVACERDLSSGIQDTYPLPVYGVLNKRPHGPCMDTEVCLADVERALRMFLRPEYLPESHSTFCQVVNH
jgi:hypothetical protein